MHERAKGAHHQFKKEKKKKLPHLSLEEHRHEHVCQVRNLIFEEKAKGGKNQG